ncbi:MAG: hypothetical protein RLZZ590_1094 [Actinomycetota bacterium]|jgi:hypothetical protein
MASIRKFGTRKLQRGGHTLILGWSPLAIEVIRELTIANENVRNPRIAILAQVSSDQIVSELAQLELGRQRFCVIQGDPTSLADLERAQVLVSNSIVDLNSDFRELEDKAIAQASTHSALAVVVEDLLSFAGDEIYFSRLPALDRKTYADAVLAFNSAAVIGFESGGQIHLNPEATTVLPEGAQIIAVAEDDDRIIYTGIREDALAKLDLTKARTLAQISDSTQGVAELGNVKAKLLAQVSENPSLLGIFENLFDPQKPNLGLVSVTDFCQPDRPIAVADLAVAAISVGYSLIGYFDSASGAVALNPKKSISLNPHQDDALVVIGSFVR